MSDDIHKQLEEGLANFAERAMASVPTRAVLGALVGKRVEVSFSHTEPDMNLDVRLTGIVANHIYNDESVVVALVDTKVEVTGREYDDDDEMDDDEEVARIAEEERETAEHLESEYGSDQPVVLVSIRDNDVFSIAADLEAFTITAEDNYTTIKPTG